MASWKESAFGDPSDEEGLGGMNPQFFSLFPNLSDFLFGEYDVKGVLVRAPGSLSLWVEDGKLKACFKLKAAGKVGFHVVHDCHLGFGALDVALGEGRIEWRKEGVRKRS